MTASTSFCRRAVPALATLAAIALIAACSRSDGSSLFSTNASRNANVPVAQQKRESTIWDLFSNRQNPSVTTAVNKYLWNASLEVLDFLPIQSVDPFTGVIVTGYGTPPGGGRSYRATIKISDPALDARSLKLALEGSGGSAVAPDTVRAVEDAILTRARQLRIRDGQY